MKVTPDMFKGLSLDTDQQYAQFLNKDENRKFLSNLRNELHMKGEGLVKFEYCLLQERAKSSIIKEYLENELGLIEKEKTELEREREKYANVLELERQLQEDKRKLDERKLEFK